MSISSRAITAEEDELVVGFRTNLGQMRDVASAMSGGTSQIDFVTSSLRTFDRIYAEMLVQWAALGAIPSAAEGTAVQAVKTALDDVLIAFADTMHPLTIPVVIDIGAGYNPAASRAVRMAALNRGFPMVAFTIPAAITSKAAALVAAIDALNAL